MGPALRYEEDAEVEGLDRASGTQQRRKPRANAFLCIDLCSEHTFWTGLTMNISEGGVFVATHVLYPPGTLVGIHLELPREKRILTLGEVRWARAYTGDDDVPPGLGIKFVDLDREALEAIRKFVTTTRPPLCVAY